MRQTLDWIEHSSISKKLYTIKTKILNLKSFFYVCVSTGLYLLLVFYFRNYMSNSEIILWWLIFEKKTQVSILAGNLNSGLSYLITAVKRFVYRLLHRSLVFTYDYAFFSFWTYFTLHLCTLYYVSIMIYQVGLEKC